jgi:2',3'-cyclic-nucleotide 2'-phosphodiesterase (5'-nucleotidase family)
MQILRNTATVVAALVLRVAPLVAQDSAHVVIVSTTDVHGRATHWDYVQDRDAPWGLDRAATVVDSLRKVYPGRVVVVDAGDLIQGDPFATYFAVVQPADPNPVVDALNAVGYDAWTPGNHEFNFGTAVLQRAVAGAGFPTISGNIYRLPRDTFAFPTNTIVVRDSVRIGITGFTTPGVMLWDRQNVNGNARVRPLIPEATRELGQLAPRVDMTVVLVHSGMNELSSYDTSGVGSENVAAQLASLPVKPDLVIVGHSHKRMQDSVIAGVHFVQPDPWAQAVSIAHVTLVRVGNRYRVRRIRADLVSLADVPPSPAMTRRFDRHREAVRSWVAKPLTAVQGNWSARLARAEDTPLIDFVNDVQRKKTGAQLSSTAAFDIQASLGPGVARMRDVAGVYPYENTLKAVRIDGARLKAYLEQSSSYFRTYRPGAPIINDSVPGFNFDIVSGVSYAIDLSQPVGSRIVQLSYQGRLVQSSDTFTMAINNYRQGGGGGFLMLAGLPVVYDRNENIRDLVVDAARKIDTLRAADYEDHSWRIIPQAAATAVHEAFAGPAPVARDTLVLRILTTNDIHGDIEPQKPGWAQGARVGGIASIKGLMDSLASECRCATLRLDGGDEFQGTPISNWSYGRPVVEALNAIGYDAAVIGNHEFDWSIDTLRARMADSRYHWLSANIEEKPGGASPEWAQPWAMVEKGGRKIGLIGISLSTTAIETRPSNVASLVFTDPAAAVRRTLPAVRQAGAQLVIVVAHSGGFCNPACGGEIFDVARKLDSGSVDLIVSGHSHSEINTRINGIPIVQARSHGTTIGLIDWVRRADGRNEIRPRILTVWTDSVRADTGVARIVSRYAEQVTKVANRTVAKLKFPLDKKVGDYPLGHLLADAQRLAARSDVAIMNNGGIRAPLPGGAVTYGQVYQVQPFENQIVKLTVPGDSLLKALEHVVRGNEPDANVSGVEVWYDQSRPEGKRVRRTRLLDGREIQRNKSYTLAVPDFMAMGGSGFGMLKGLPSEPTSVNDVEALMNYLRRLPSPIEVPDSPRIHPEK